MNPVQSFLQSIVGLAPAITVGSVVAGLLFPALAALLRPLVVPVSILIVVASVARIDPAAIFRHFSRPAFIASVGVTVLVLTPLLVGALAATFGLSGTLMAGLVLAAAAPPISSASAFALLVSVDASLVTAMTVPATLAAPFTIVFVAYFFPGLDGILDVTPFVLRLGGIIFLAFAIAYAIHRLAGRAAIARLERPLDAAMIVAIAIVGIGMMNDVGAALREAPFDWLRIFAFVAVLNAGSCLAGLLIFSPFGVARAKAAGLCMGIRNMALMVAVTLGTVDPAISLVVITAQLPIFLAPAYMRPLFRMANAARIHK